MPGEGSSVRSMAELGCSGPIVPGAPGSSSGHDSSTNLPGTVRRIEPEDILNNVYLKLHQRWPEIASAHTPSSRLLYQAAKDCLIDAWRLHKRQNRDVEREVPWPERASQELGSKLAASLTSPTECSGVRS